MILVLLVLIFLTGSAQSQVERCHAKHRIPSGARDFHDLDHRPGLTHDDCKDVGGLVCDDCCSGTCCEDVSRTDPFPVGVELWVPIVVVVVRPEPLDPAIIARQVATLNTDYAGTRVFFTLDSVVRVTDPTLATRCNSDPCVKDLKCLFYETVLKPVSLRTDRFVYVILCDTPYLGEATFPWQFAESDYRKYVQASFISLTGVSSTMYYGLGRTLSHEVGHYFGLLHTFWRDGECDSAGDYVGDTPSQREQAKSYAPCDRVQDTCPGPGVDDTSNFMDYSADRCMTHFTPGQVTRMQQSIRQYYPALYAASAVRGGVCPHRGDTNLSRCVCDNGKNPATWCKSGTPPPPVIVGPTATPTKVTKPPATTPNPYAIITPSPEPLEGEECREISLCHGGGRCVVSHNDTLCVCNNGFLGRHCEYCPPLLQGWDCDRAVAITPLFLSAVGTLIFPREGLKDITVSVVDAELGAFKIATTGGASPVRVQGPPVVVRLAASGSSLKVFVAGSWLSSQAQCEPQGIPTDAATTVVCFLDTAITVGDVTGVKSIASDGYHIGFSLILPLILTFAILSAW